MKLQNIIIIIMTIISIAIAFWYLQDSSPKLWGASLIILLTIFLIINTKEYFRRAK